MTESIESGRQTISGTVTTSISNLGFVSGSASQTLVKATFTNVANGATVYTTTAGKTFYLIGYAFECPSAGSGVVSIAGTQVPFRAGIEVILSSSIPLTSVAASTAITVTSGSAGNYGMIWGFEQ